MESGEHRPPHVVLDGRGLGIHEQVEQAEAGPMGMIAR